jgi:cytoskeleton protein RodZ
MASSQFTLIDNPSAANVPVVSTVEELVARRNSLGMSIETLAQQLRLPVKQLNHIEAGEFSAMSSLAFARAVLRAYAKAVGANADPVIRQIGTFGEAADLRDSSTVNQPVESRGMLGFGQSGSGSRWLWAALGLLGLGVLAFFFNPAQQGIQKMSSGLFPKPGTSNGTVTTQTPALANAPVPSQTAVQKPVATQAELKFELVKSSWVEVTQVVDGVETTQVLTNSGAEPQNYSLNVKLPASIVIGNAEAVTVLRDGKPLDIKSSIVSNLAKLEVK